MFGTTFQTRILKNLVFIKDCCVRCKGKPKLGLKTAAPYLKTILSTYSSMNSGLEERDISSAADAIASAFLRREREKSN